MSASTRALTDRVREAADVVTRYYARYRVPPSLREIADGLGAKQKGTAHALVSAAVQHGLLVRADPPPGELSRLASRLYLPPLESTCPTCGRPR